MSFELDIAGDFGAVTDGLHAITVNGTDVEKCLRREVKTEEVEASGGKYLNSDTVFHIDASEYETRPVIGGSIVDDGGSWTVLSVQWQTFVRRWRCICRQLYLDPASTVTIQQATYAKGTTGAEEPTWSTLVAGVVARVQLVSEDVAVTHLNRTSSQLAKVFFAVPQNLGPSCRIHAPSGAILKVISWDGFSDLDQFFTATCEVSKWPQA